MKKYIALLRGINVGGRRKILMADLREMLSKMGFANIVTYIQSGNVLFNTDSKLSVNDLENNIHKSILKRFEFDVPVIIRNIEEIEQIILENPFIEGKDYDKERLHLTFLKDEPSRENILKTLAYDFSPDRFEIRGNNVFIYCKGKSTDSKITNIFFEKKLSTSSTTRSWKTVLKLAELSGN